jgi:hypothetical protein
LAVPKMEGPINTGEVATRVYGLLREGPVLLER